jgi:hypothetical protein
LVAEPVPDEPDVVLPVVDWAAGDGVGVGLLAGVGVGVGVGVGAGFGAGEAAGGGGGGGEAPPRMLCMVWKLDFLVTPSAATTPYCLCSPVGVGGQHLYTDSSRNV